jgi:hypothetical protein
LTEIIIIILAVAVVLVITAVLVLVMAGMAVVAVAVQKLALLPQAALEEMPVKAVMLGIPQHQMVVMVVLILAAVVVQVMLFKQGHLEMAALELLFLNTPTH